MDFGDQRAGGINHTQQAVLGFLANRGWNAVSTENENGIGRDFLNGFDKDGASAAELLDNISVVHDFVVHIDGRAIRLQRKLNDIYCADDTGAKSAGTHTEQGFGGGCRLNRHLAPKLLKFQDSIISKSWIPCMGSVSGGWRAGVKTCQLGQRVLACMRVE